MSRVAGWRRFYDMREMRGNLGSVFNRVEQGKYGGDFPLFPMMDKITGERFIIRRRTVSRTCTYIGTCVKIVDLQYVHRTEDDILQEGRIESVGSGTERKVNF